MKASVKLRAEERKPPLLRAKLPILGPLGLPLVSSATASAAGAAVGDPVDLSFHLRTALPGGPSVKLSYRPGDPFSPFSLSLLSGVGLWGSPGRSPILFSATLPLAAAGGGAAAGVSFSILLKPEVGDFTFKKTIAVAPSTPAPDPNPNARIMNGGGVYHPLPVVTPPRAERPPLMEDLFSASGAVVEATTAVPVTSRAALKLRCGLNFPRQTADPGPTWRLPYLTVNKISFEVTEGEARKKESPSTAEVSRARSDWDLEAKGMGYWFRREVEELRRENRMIKEGLEQVWKKVSERRGAFGHGGIVEVSKAALDNRSNNSSGRRKWKEGS